MKKNLTLITASILLGTFLLSAVAVAQETAAAPQKPTGGKTLEQIQKNFDPAKSEVLGGIKLDHIKNLPVDKDVEGFSGLYSSIAKILLAVSTVGVFMAFIVAGTMMALGQTNEQVIETAKKIITYTLVGVAIILVAYSVVFGITQLEPFG